MKIGLSPWASEAVEVSDLTPDQLYDALEAWTSERDRLFGKRRSEEATQFRLVANPTLRAIRAEIQKRNLPRARPKREGPEDQAG